MLGCVLLCTPLSVISYIAKCDIHVHETLIRHTHVNIEKERKKEGLTNGLTHRNKQTLHIGALQDISTIATTSHVMHNYCCMEMEGQNAMCHVS